MSGVNKPNQVNNHSHQQVDLEVNQKITRINPRKPSLLSKIVSKVSAFATALFGTVAERAERKESRAKNATIKKELSGLKTKLKPIQSAIRNLQEDGKAPDQAMINKEEELEKAINDMESKLKK